MTTPPPEDDDRDRTPPSYWPVGYPAQPGHPPPGYPPPYPYGPPPQNRRTISAGATVGGAFIYVALNGVLGLLLVVFAGSYLRSDNVVFGVGAGLFALIAFGLGGALLATRGPIGKGLGLGLMIGWALTSVFTVGFCTGINPAMYT
ncbi:MAG: hypothetical protein SW019_02115 [Actinomycetota bacterium]|nr:hypothetical protein [Actinomycetota bacterium]